MRPQAVFLGSLERSGSALTDTHESLTGICVRVHTTSVVEIVVTDEFKDWYEALESSDQDDVRRVVNLLEHQGVALGEPYSSAIRGSKHALRELRIQSKGRPIRIFYAFDPLRQAVLLIAGDKTGDARFYDVYVPKAEKLWEEYVAGLKKAAEKPPGRGGGG